MRCSIRIGLVVGLVVTLGLATGAGAGELPKQLIMAVTPSNIPTELFKASLETALNYGTRIVGLRQGRVIFDGPPGSITPAIVEDIYQGGVR